MTEPSQQKPHQNRGSRQRAAQDKLERMEHEGGNPFFAAVEATRMPMLVTDPTIASNPIIYVNAAFLEMCGYDREEVLGCNYHFLTGVDTDPEVSDKIDAALNAQESTIIEVRFDTKSGRKIWVSQHVNPLKDERGRTVQHFASFMDITGRKQVEDRLRRMAEGLERRVQTRTKMLEQTNTELKQEIQRRSALETVLHGALAEKQELVLEKEFMFKEVNHRIKNTLQMAQSLLITQASQTDSDRVKDALRSAIQRLDRLAEIHALLYTIEDYRRIDVATHLETLSRGLLMSLQQGFDPITLEADIDEVAWGPDLVLPLSLIVNEAVSNSLKHAFPDGDEGTIRVELHPLDRNTYRLTIRDNGIGVSSERRENSLGLRLVDLLAEQIDGTALIRNEEGTVVSITFPV